MGKKKEKDIVVYFWILFQNLMGRGLKKERQAYVEVPFGIRT
jgi:hypothetical protein